MTRQASNVLLIGLGILFVSIAAHAWLLGISFSQWIQVLQLTVAVVVFALAGVVWADGVGRRHIQHIAVLQAIAGLAIAAHVFTEEASRQGNLGYVLNIAVKLVFAGVCLLTAREARKARQSQSGVGTSGADERAAE